MMKKITIVATYLSFCFLIPVLIRANNLVSGIHMQLQSESFLITNDTLLLPMTLIKFSAQQSEHNCYLLWTAVREEYSTAWHVERSLDGKTFIEAGTTMGLGKETGMQQFSYTDIGAANLGSGKVFYRLRQLNAEGKSEYTHVLVVTITCNRNIAYIFPNPARDRTNLLIEVMEEQGLDWQIVDQEGRQLQGAHVKIFPGSARTPVNLAGLSSGIYFIQLKSRSINRLIKLIKN